MKRFQNYQIRTSFYGFCFFCFMIWITAYAQGTNSEHPSFIASSEKVSRVIDEKIYAVQSKVQRLAVHGQYQDVWATTRLYITDGNGNLTKTVDLFPSTIEFPVMRKIDESKNCLYLYLYSGKRGSIKNDVLILDKNGNQLAKCNLENKQEKVVWNEEKKTASVIYPYEAIVKVFSQNGNLVTKKNFSNHFYKENYDRPEDAGDVDDAKEMGFSYKVSETGKYILMSRFVESGPNAFNEMILLDSTGDILFYQDLTSKNEVPDFVDEQEEIFIVNKKSALSGKASFAGFDFKGDKLWETETNGLFINDSSENKPGLVNLKRLDDFHIVNANIELNIKTGAVVKGD